MGQTEINLHVIPVPASLDEIDILLEIERLEIIALPIRCYIKDALEIGPSDQVGPLNLRRIDVTIDTSAGKWYRKNVSHHE